MLMDSRFRNSCKVTEISQKNRFFSQFEQGFSSFFAKTNFVKRYKKKTLFNLGNKKIPILPKNFLLTLHLWKILNIQQLYKVD